MTSKKRYQKPVALNGAKKRFEVQDIMEMYGDYFLENQPASLDQKKVMRHIRACRTARLGGHLEACNECGHERNAYNSCRDRHCPKCQTLVKEKWLSARKAELLPTGYFHNVFTLDHMLNPIILCNREVCFKILFASVNETLKAFAKDKQWRLVGQIGFIAVLHTWNQLLLDHFHLHCLIPAGVLTFDKKKWQGAPKERYLFRITSLAKEFKKRYLNKLKLAYTNKELIFPGKTKRFGTQKAFQQLIDRAFMKTWIAYTKRPFGGPEQVLEYLGRYTHRVAISNNRILAVDNGKVTFSYRDRKDNDTLKEKTVPADEFIRRFLLHVLPGGFMKIRYYGFLARTNKKWSIPLLRKLIDPTAKMPEKIVENIQEMYLRLTGVDITCCPKCKKGRMVFVKNLPSPYG